MERILNLNKQISNIDEKRGKLDQQIEKLNDEISLPSFDNIQYTLHTHNNPIKISVSDTTLSDNSNLPHEEQFKKLFYIENYEIKDLTDHFKSLSNYQEILKESQNWCDKSLELENASSNENQNLFNSDFTQDQDSSSNKQPVKKVEYQAIGSNENQNQNKSQSHQ